MSAATPLPEDGGCALMDNGTLAQWLDSMRRAPGLLDKANRDAVLLAAAHRLRWDEYRLSHSQGAAQ